MVNGKKKYEYRTRYSNKETVAFVYVSQTIKKICGLIYFDRPVVGSAEEISRLSESCNPGSYSVMMEYFRNGTGYAIPIKRVIEFPPISLDKIKSVFPTFVVPQSYYYLDTKEKKELFEYILAESNIRGIDFGGKGRCL